MHDLNAQTEMPPARAAAGGQRIWRFVLPLIVLASGAGIASLFLSTSPRARSKPPGHAATLVEVTPVVFASRPASISAMGTVTPALSIDLHPQVNGEIVDVSENFVPGGIFNEGEIILRIDRTDYELAVQRISKAVAQAKTDLRMEQANQAIAKKDFEVLGDVMVEGDRDMVLRKPQLELAQASVEAATAELEKAKVDLVRTTVKAPFNAVVRSRQVNVGTRVTEATSLATLIGTDTYWVEIAVPVNQLRWIRIPKNTGEEGSKARIVNEAAWGANESRVGRVVRMAADLEEQGRMARLFVAVEDPICLQPDHQDLPAMLIGSYVRAEIEGRMLESVAVLPRALLHEGDTAWIYGLEGKLEIRPVEVAFRGLKEVLVSAGLQPGDRVVTSDLSTPVNGMQLRNESANPAPVSSQAETAEPPRFEG